MDKINLILEELYAIDPSLKQHEIKLKKIAQKMISASPQGELENDFSQRLRDQLMSKAMEMKNTKANAGFRWYSVSFAGAGAVVAIILMWVALPGVFKTDQGIPSIVTDLGFNTELSVKSTSNSAFGSLASTNGSGQETAPLGLGGDVQVKATSDTSRSSVPATGMGGGGSSASTVAPDKMILPYEPVNYKFVYKGDEFEMPTGSSPVLKRVKNSDGGSKLGQMLNTISFGLFNVKSFEKPKVMNISFTEDKDQGYIVSSDFDNEALSIYRNYNKWPQMLSYQPLSPDKMKSDKEIIDIASSFVKKYGVSVSMYGAPVVDKTWTRYQPLESSYVPDGVQVIYPMQYNGKTVLDEGGMPAGPRVNVSLRDGKAESAWEFKTNDFLSSDYALETDKSKIMGVAEKGGLYRGWYEGGKTVEIEIGAPELSYVRLNQYKDNTNQELLVPALIFPILNKPAENFYQEKVIVPLVKEILDNNNQPPYMIMERSVQ